MNARLFLSCDWGTTAFRLRLVAADGFKVVAESESKQGNAAVFEAWKQRGKQEGDRVRFYQAILKEHLAKLEAQADFPKDIPLIISGMASSTVGMMELPYKDIPFALDGADLDAKLIPPSVDFVHAILLISGVRTEDDVMRGEEVQVVGCCITGNEERFILHPGTHCKHIRTKSGSATTFKTYMTGEFFSLLSSKSILAASVQENRNFDVPGNRAQFEAGVASAVKEGLLHGAFLIRTGDLFGKRSKEDAFYFLSGLLIGAELQHFPADFSGPLILAGEDGLVTQYKAALEILGIAQRLQSIDIKSADAITLAGQWAVYLNHSSSTNA